jgi:alpha-1,6-mannosyltransferase
VTSRRARVALALLLIGYVAVEAVAGAPRSPLVPPMPPGVTAPEWTARLASLVGADRLGVGALIAVGIALMAGLVAAFAVLLLEAWHGRVGVWAVVGSAAAAIAITAAGPLLLSRDVFSYAAYGRIVALHGANPYVVAPARFATDPFTVAASPQYAGVSSVYGPAFTLLSAAIARAWSRSPAATIEAFKVVAGLCVLIAVGVLAAVRSKRRAFAAAAVGLNPVLVVHVVGGGHNDALLTLLLVVAASLAVRPQAGAALSVTGLLAMATLVKAFAVVPLLIWVWSLVRAGPPRERLRIAASHLGVAALLAVAASVPFLAGTRTLRWIVNASSLEGWASGPRLLTRAARAVGLGSAGARAVDAVFLVGFAVILWRILSLAVPHAATRTWAWALLLLALALPYLVPWYAAWFLPLLVVAVDGRLLRIGLFASGLLALTGIPSDPTFASGAWHAMVFAVHYVAAPLMLGLLALAARTIWEETREAAHHPVPGGG